MDASPVLDLGAFVSSEAMDTPVSTEYGLAAVLVHEGSMATSGHYRTYRVVDDSVMLFDDSHVRRVNRWPTNGYMYAQLGRQRR